MLRKRKKLEAALAKRGIELTSDPVENKRRGKEAHGY